MTYGTIAPQLVLLFALATASLADEATLVRTYPARDSLAAEKDKSSDAQQCIDNLIWQATKFAVTCESENGARYDKLVRFPSPVSSGDKVNDLVAMEWYMPRDEKERVIKAPVMLVVHESGSNMPVGRLFAHSLQSKGFHAFLIHLPHYGKRRTGKNRPDASVLVKTIRQAVGDVRRARDAIAVLPDIDTRHIGIQGTSLGGFVVATSASLDSCFDNVFIMLAGGNLYELIMNGEKDAAKVRQLLANAGYTDEKLKKLLSHIEPTRVAHRLNRKTTWLFTAEHDHVVPIVNAEALAKAAHLDDDHHVRLFGNHYTAIAHFPDILKQMVTHIQSSSDLTTGE